jgi:hypothetical protein
MPDSVVSIGERTFSFTSENFEYSPLSNKTAGITAYIGKDTDLTIPTELNGYTIISICNSAFDSCEDLTSIIIPDSVILIGNSAFYNCNSLTSITIPDSVTSIGNEAFAYCSNLTSITVPNGVTTIGMFMFYNCKYLRSITISDSVTSIGESAFGYCSSLTSVVVPNSVTSIGNNAFDECRNLKSITIPESVTFIGDEGYYVFAYGYGLTIYGYIGTYAETYANENDISFVSLGDIPTPTETTTTSTTTSTSTTTKETTTTTKATTTTTIPTSSTTKATTTSTTPMTTTTEETTTEPVVTIPTKLSVTIKNVAPTSAKIYVERTEGGSKGALSYVLLKGDYSATDFSTATMSDLKNNTDFVAFETSNWTKNCNFNITNLDKNQTYTVVPITQRRGHIYFFGLGENATFTTPDISLETEIKKITASSVKFRISRTGAANGALGYVLLKGDYSDVNYKTLEEYTAMTDFVSNRTSNWRSYTHKQKSRKRRNLHNYSLHSKERRLFIRFRRKYSFYSQINLFLQ